MLGDGMASSSSSGLVGRRFVDSLVCTLLSSLKEGKFTAGRFFRTFA